MKDVVSFVPAEVFQAFPFAGLVRLHVKRFRCAAQGCGVVFEPDNPVVIMQDPTGKNRLVCSDEKCLRKAE